MQGVWWWRYNWKNLESVGRLNMNFDYNTPTAPSKESGLLRMNWFSNQLIETVKKVSQLTRSFWKKTKKYQKPVFNDLNHISLQNPINLKIQSASSIGILRICWRSLQTNTQISISMDGMTTGLFWPNFRKANSNYLELRSENYRDGNCYNQYLVPGGFKVFQIMKTNRRICFWWNGRKSD